jgi:hypothetical protein
MSKGGVGQLFLLFCHPLPLPQLWRGLFPLVLTTAVNCDAVVLPEMLSVDQLWHCTVV